jgi:uncharacterized protein YjbI with pentapeptide repeats
MRARPGAPTPPDVPAALERQRGLRLADLTSLSESEVEDSFIGQSADDLELRRSRLFRSALTSCRMHRMHLTDVLVEGCDWSGADLEEATLTRVHFRDCRMSALSVARSSLRDVLFSDCRIDDANLRMCDLERVTFDCDDLRSADFSGTTFKNARLFDCNLTGADFSKVAARGTRLHGSVLMELKGAGDLRGVVIDSTQLVPLGVQVLGAIGIAVEDERDPEADAPHRDHRRVR